LLRFSAVTTKDRVSSSAVEAEKYFCRYQIKLKRRKNTRKRRALASANLPGKRFSLTPRQSGEPRRNSRLCRNILCNPRAASVKRISKNTAVLPKTCILILADRKNQRFRRYRWHRRFCFSKKNFDFQENRFINPWFLLAKNLMQKY